MTQQTFTCAGCRAQEMAHERGLRIVRMAAFLVEPGMTISGQLIIGIEIDLERVFLKLEDGSQTSLEALSQVTVGVAPGD